MPSFTIIKCVFNEGLGHWATIYIKRMRMLVGEIIVPG